MLSCAKTRTPTSSKMAGSNWVLFWRDVIPMYIINVGIHYEEEEEDEEDCNPIYAESQAKALADCHLRGSTAQKF